MVSRSAHSHSSPKLALSSASSSYYDPHISREDEEIRRLERLLKVDAPGGRQKLRKELGELDGLGEVYIYVCACVLSSLELKVQGVFCRDVNVGALLSWCRWRTMQCLAQDSSYHNK